MNRKFLSIIIFFILIFTGCGSDDNADKTDSNTEFLVYEDATDTTTSKWSVRRGSSERAMVENVYDEELESRVISLQGAGTSDAYVMGAESGDGAWNERRHKTISWMMKYSEDSVFYVMVETTFGIRYLFYTPSYNRALFHGSDREIHHGLGESIKDGRWRSITRDLESDLKDAEPNNELLRVNGFIVRGSGMIDDLLLSSPNRHVYEDAINVEDSYLIGASDGKKMWENRSEKIIQWSFKEFGEDPRMIADRGEIHDRKAVEFRLFVDTVLGKRELIYRLGEEDLALLENGTTIHHALGDDRILGSVLVGDNNTLGLWQTVTRDIAEDIKDFEPSNTLVAINGFKVRGHGLINNIQTISSAKYEY